MVATAVMIVGSTWFAYLVGAIAALVGAVEAYKNLQSLQDNLSASLRKTFAEHRGVTGS